MVRLATEGAKTRPVSTEPFLSLSFNSYKCKIKSWSDKKKQAKWRACDRYGTNQQCLEGPTDRYIQFINTLDMKNCRLLVGLLTEPINLRYMLHKMGWVKTPTCRKYSIEKKMLFHIMCKCLALEKERAQMNPSQLKEA